MMKNGLVISDSGPIISLALVGKLWLLEELFDEIKIPKSVWEELTSDSEKLFVDSISIFFKDKVSEISTFNEFLILMDKGESESLTLYRELNADFLLIDDLKARKIAEIYNINCIGTLGVLIASKRKGLIPNLKPEFEEFLLHKRFYGIELLNKILLENGEEII